MYVCAHICIHVHGVVGANRPSSCLVLQKGDVSRCLWAGGVQNLEQMLQVDGLVCGQIFLCQFKNM